MWTVCLSAWCRAISAQRPTDPRSSAGAGARRDAPGRGFVGRRAIGGGRGGTTSDGLSVLTRPLRSGARAPEARHGVSRLSTSGRSRS
ncbi:hypothetical protein UA74_10175 [Actinoalloteichus fjordicus]|uniref:Uncharacterized protein n=1 Tax=Actinoalloteichus fjordicus TaxID=1612552 RepID=A0AAC9LAB7_9PSEU|nr:hypothetical protein UA74_10175 [Actinoalloteichus fjordicus]